MKLYVSLLGLISAASAQTVYFKDGDTVFKVTPFEVLSNSKDLRSKFIPLENGIATGDEMVGDFSTSDGNWTGLETGSGYEFTYVGSAVSFAFPARCACNGEEPVVEEIYDDTVVVEIPGGLRRRRLLIGAISNVVNTVTDSVVDTANNVADGVVDTANTIGDGVVDLANTVADGVVDAANTVADGVEDAANVVGNSLSGIIDGIIDDVTGAANDVMNQVTKILRIHGRLKDTPIAEEQMIESLATGFSVEGVEDEDIEIMGYTHLGGDLYEVEYRVHVKGKDHAAIQEKTQMLRDKKGAGFTLPGFQTLDHDAAVSAVNMVGAAGANGSHGAGLPNGYSCTADAHCRSGDCFGGMCESLKSVLPAFSWAAYSGNDDSEKRAKSIYGFVEDCSHHNKEGGIWSSDEKKMVIMAVRGTDMYSTKDFVTNSRMLDGSWDKVTKVPFTGIVLRDKDPRWVSENNRYQAAKAKADALGYELVLTGHSMGGAMVLEIADRHAGEFSGWVFNPWCDTDNMDQKNVHISQSRFDTVVSGTNGKCNCHSRRGRGGKSCSHSDYDIAIRDMKGHTISNYLRDDQVSFLKSLKAPAHATC